jgi:hypothetical protein
MPGTASTGGAPSDSPASGPLVGQSFLSNWQVQLAVLANENDGNPHAPGTEQGNGDGAREMAHGGSAASPPTASLRIAGTQNAVRAALGTHPSFPGGKQPGEEGARTRAGVAASALNRAQLPVSVLTQQSGKSPAADDRVTSKNAMIALQEKAPKLSEVGAASLTPGMPGAFAAFPCGGVAQTASSALPPPPLSSTSAASEARPLSDGSFDSFAPVAKSAATASGVVQPFSSTWAMEAKQLHKETTVSNSDEILLTPYKSSNQAGATPSVGTGALAIAPSVEPAQGAEMALISTQESAFGANGESTAIQADRLELPVLHAAGVASTGVDRGRAESSTAELKTASAPSIGQDANRVALPGNPGGAPTIPAPITAQIPVNSDVSKVNSAAVPGAKRTTNGVEAMGPGTVTAQAQLVAGAGGTASIARDFAGMQPAMNPAVGHDVILSAPTIHETFAALDSQPAPGAITWTHAGARQAEAGFEDPALGWVGVRADTSGGGVHATLLPGSAEAAQALGQHLEGLSAYMTQQHTPVESLGMAAPGSRDNHPADQGPSQGMNQGAGQGPEGGQDQAQRQNAQTQSWVEPESGPALPTTGVDSRVSSANAVQIVASEAAARAQIDRAGHISVVA